MINGTRAAVKPPDAPAADTFPSPIAPEREKHDTGPEVLDANQGKQAPPTAGAASAVKPDASSGDPATSRLDADSISPVETSLIGQQSIDAVRAGPARRRQPPGELHRRQKRLAEMHRNHPTGDAGDQPTQGGRDGDPPGPAPLADQPDPVDNENSATDRPDPYLPVEAPPSSPPTFEETLAWLELYVEPGQVTELRILDAREPNRPNGPTFRISGFFESDRLGDLVGMARNWTRHAKGVYVTLNPVDPELLAVRRNIVEKYPKKTAGDGDILRRRLLMVDVDPFRFPATTGRKFTSGISSTDGEKARARGMAEAIYWFLREQGWPDPIAVDSGNGYQLLYRIDEAADDDGLVQRCLQALAARFDDEGAEVDRKVFNPARIAKLPGTLARKGEDAGE